MKENVKALLACGFLIILLISYVYIAIYLGLKLPYQLWSNGDWAFAIAQAVIVWSWLLGGKRK